MSSVHEFWTPVYNAFDPWRMLWGEELKNYFVEREGSPLKELASQLSPDRVPQKVLLSGHMGSGKTSELMKLSEQLSEDFFVVWFDAFYSLDLAASSYLELLFSMGMALYKAGEVDLKLELDKGLRDDFAKSLATIVQKQTGNQGFEIDIGRWVSNIVSFGLGIAGVRIPALSLQGLSLGVSEEVTAQREIKPEIPKVSDRLNDIISEVQAKCRKPLLLIVDGLDKMPLKKAQPLFAETPVLSSPGCRVIYLAPISFFFSPDFLQAKGLFYTSAFPNVKLYERGEPDKVYEPGLNIMRQVVIRRLRSLGLDEKEVIDSGALDHLAMMSGGVMREMVLLVREATVEAELADERSITVQSARKAAYSLRRQYAAGLRKSHYEELTSLLKSAQPSEEEVFNELLEGLYVLSYANDDLWYDVHPNVRPLIEGV